MVLGLLDSYKYVTVSVFQFFIECPEGNTTFEHFSYLCVFPDQQTALGVFGCIAYMYKNAFKCRHVQKPWQIATTEVILFVFREFGRLDLQRNLVAACRDGRRTITFLALVDTDRQTLFQSPVSVFNGVTEIHTVDIQPPDGVRLFPCYAFKPQFHQSVSLFRYLAMATAISSGSDLCAAIAFASSITSLFSRRSFTSAGS